MTERSENQTEKRQRFADMVRWAQDAVAAGVGKDAIVRKLLELRIGGGRAEAIVTHLIQQRQESKSLSSVAPPGPVGDSSQTSEAERRDPGLAGHSQELGEAQQPEGGQQPTPSPGWDDPSFEFWYQAALQEDGDKPGTSVTASSSANSSPSGPQRKHRRLLWCIVAGLLVTLVVGSVIQYSAYARTNESAGNLAQITLGIRFYQDTFGRNVDDIRDRHGRPLLSWRVAVLPLIEQDHLYKQFHLDEPWDSPHNLQLLTKMPKPYRHPSRLAEGETETVYQRVTGPLTLFEGAESKKLTAQNVPDGLTSTALLFEAEQPVPWTKPADLLYKPGTPLPSLRRSYGGYLVAFADGAVRSIPFDTNEATLLALITPRGGESVSIERFPKNRHVEAMYERIEKWLDRSGMRR